MSNHKPIVNKKVNEDSIDYIIAKHDLTEANSTNEILCDQIAESSQKVSEAAELASAFDVTHFFL